MRRDLINKRSRILITAGPTREHIDPIRFISNYSTGRFGFEIAKEAVRRENPVTLIAGPAAYESPKGLRFIQVESAVEMRRAIAKEFPKSNCVIMASAVSDWRPASIAKRKIKKHPKKKRMRLELVENPDILKELGRHKKDKILVGFALETEELEANAIKKLKEKNLDLIVANIFKPGIAPFGDKRMDVLMIDRFGNRVKFRRKSKEELAKIILDKVENFKI